MWQPRGGVAHHPRILHSEKQNAHETNDQVQLAAPLPLFAIVQESYLHTAKQPGLCRTPVAAHGHERYFEDFGRFFQTQSAKVAQFDNTTFSQVEFSEFCQGLIKNYEFRSPLLRHYICLSE